MEISDKAWRGFFWIRAKLRTFPKERYKELFDFLLRDEDMIKQYEEIRKNLPWGVYKNFIEWEMREMVEGMEEMRDALLSMREKGEITVLEEQRRKEAHHGYTDGGGGRENMEEAISALPRKDWENFRSLKYALNHAPIEMIAAIDDSVWRNHGFTNDGDFKALYRKIPEGTLKMIHGAWAKTSLEGLNGVFQWMEEQISRGMIRLIPTDELPGEQDDSQDTQIHFQKADNLHREQ